MRTLSYLSVPCPCTRRLFRRSSSSRVVGQNRAAIAIAAERLGRKKARRGRVPEGAELASLIGRAKTLRGIVEHEQVFGLRDSGDRIVIGRQARTDRPGSPPSASDPCFFAVAIAYFRLSASMLKVSACNIDEDRRRADKRHHFCRRAEGEGRAEHRVAGADVLRHQHQHQRVGAAGAGQRMFRAAECRELALRTRKLPAPSETGNDRARAPSRRRWRDPSRRRCAATSMKGMGFAVDPGVLVHCAHGLQKR